MSYSTEIPSKFIFSIEIWFDSTRKAPSYEIQKASQCVISKNYTTVEPVLTVCLKGKQQERACCENEAVAGTRCLKPQDGQQL